MLVIRYSIIHVECQNELYRFTVLQTKQIKKDKKINLNFHSACIERANAELLEHWGHHI